MEEEQNSAKLQLEWNTYKEGFKKIKSNDDRYISLSDLEVNSINESIWNINKNIDQVLVRKVTI